MFSSVLSLCDAVRVGCDLQVELTRRQMVRHGVDPDTGLPLDKKLVAW